MGEEGRHDLEKARVRYAIETSRSRTREARERTLPTDHSHAARHRDAGAIREYQRDSSSKRPTFLALIVQQEMKGRSSLMAERRSPH
jgi:hypothetical protein